jgi:hypothetical protein
VSPIVVSAVVLACILAGVALGMALRNRLPEHHLAGDAKDVVRLGSGLIGTIAALVLGLLIASANSSYGTQSTQIQELTARFILLDNILDQYGPETKPVRQSLRRAVGVLADRIWRENIAGSRQDTVFGASQVAEEAEAGVLRLAPSSDVQRLLKDRAVQASIDMAQTRLLLFAQRGDSLPMPFLVVLVFWLAMIFMSFSLFAKPNAFIIGALVVFAVSATASIFVILELSQPFSGLMRIPSEPLRNALAPLTS